MEGLIIIVIVAAILIPLFLKKINQGEVGLVEVLGKFSHEVGPGLTFLIPGLNTLRKIDIREQMITVPEQQIITKDNVGMAVDGIIYVQITNAQKAQYEISNVFMAVINLAQTNLRNVLGTMTLDDTLSNRDSINIRLLEALDRETVKWGIKVMRVEIKRLDPPHAVQEQMNSIKNAQSEKSARVMEAEGYKLALITKSEADKQSKILQAEGEKQSQILRAEGEAQAKVAIAQAQAKALELESLAAQEYFKGQAVAKEQLKVVENALSANTKYILDSDILTSVSKAFGIK